MSKAQDRQKILVFQQNDSAESKIAGIREYGEGRFDIEVISVNDELPPLLDDTDDYLPAEIRADIVLDFFKHPDLSYDLGEKCAENHIPIVASGKKIRIKEVITPPT